jgi:hypothetical protein
VCACIYTYRLQIEAEAAEIRVFVTNDFISIELITVTKYPETVDIRQR